MNREQSPPREPLTKDRVFRAAARLADCDGLGALTKRRLGADLQVEAMALYKHVADKEEILDGILELVLAEIDTPPVGTGWKEGMWRRAVSARDALRRHSWTLGLLERRGIGGPAARRYVDTALGNLRLGGFSIENAAHAFWVVDSFVYGHVVHEVSLADRGSGPPPRSEPVSADEHPFLAEVADDAAESHYSLDREFDFGLRLILDAIEAYRENA